MPRRKSNAFWNNTKLTLPEINLKDKLEFAITNRVEFIVLYIIDPDLVVYSITKQIRENNVDVGVSDEILEDVIAPLIDKIFGEQWLLTSELNRGFSELKNKVIAILAQNENQKKQNVLHKQKW